MMQTIGPKTNNIRTSRESTVQKTQTHVTYKIRQHLKAWARIPIIKPIGVDKRDRRQTIHKEISTLTYSMTICDIY